MCTKKCSSVHHTGNEELPLSEFYKQSSSKDGLNNWCRKCCKVDNRLRREQKAQKLGKTLRINTPGRPHHSASGYRRHVPSSINMKVRQQLRAIRVKCKAKNIPFSITVDDLLPLPTHCPDLGIELEYFSKLGYFPNRATIDKIVPKQGYIPGNVRIISNQANAMKQDANPDQLKQIALSWLKLVERLTDVDIQ